MVNDDEIDVTVVLKANDEKAKNATEVKKEIANSQKAELNDILNERNRPSWAKPSLNKVYLIPRA